MDVKKIALLVGALVIAVVTAVMAKNMFTGAGAEAASKLGYTNVKHFSGGIKGWKAADEKLEAAEGSKDK